MNFWPRWRHRRLYFASLHNEKKDYKKNIKNKKNQNCQKIKLYESPTIKELKKKHSSRPVGGVKMGSWSEDQSKPGEVVASRVAG